VAKSWGWDLETGQSVANEVQKWTGYQVRLGKMLDSLRLLGQDDLRRRLSNFLNHERITPTVEGWIRELVLFE
jgi:hypothetical protein